MRILLIILFLLPSSAFAFEELKISLSDIDVIDIDIDEKSILVSVFGSNESIDLDISKKLGAFELAFNPTKGSIYAEVDFLAFHDKDHTKRIESNNKKIAFVSMLVLGGLIAFHFSSKNKRQEIVDESPLTLRCSKNSNDNKYVCVDV